MKGILNDFTQFGIMPAVIIRTKPNSMKRDTKRADGIPDTDELDDRILPTVCSAERFRFAIIRVPFLLPINMICFTRKRICCRSEDTALSNQSYETPGSICTAA